MTKIVFTPESASHQTWIITEHYVTVCNHGTGESATLPMIRFITELHKLGLYRPL